MYAANVFQIVRIDLYGMSQALSGLRFGLERSPWSNTCDPYLYFLSDVLSLYLLSCLLRANMGHPDSFRRHNSRL